MMKTVIERWIAVKIKAPVNSLESAVKQIQAGADEIYMGMDDSLFSKMSFSARAQVTSHGVHSTLPPREFKEIVDYAHSMNVLVDFTVNCQFVSNSHQGFLRKHYLEHVIAGIDMGVDALIVSDIGNIIFLRENGITTPIIAGSYFNAFNVETINLLANLGVVRVCLPDQMKLCEIKEIIDKTNLEMEVFIGYGCANLSGSCNFCHNNGEQIHVGVTCRNEYDIEGCNKCNILDACCDCAICSIPFLIDIGVQSAKLVGRESSGEDFYQITRMYRNAIDSYKATGHFDKDKIMMQVPWWKNAMCSMRCKYSSNYKNIYQTYI